MLRFAANLSTLWAEMPYLDRFDAAAEAGFTAVEVPDPYDAAAPETQAALQRNDLGLVALSAPGPNYTGGARGFAAIPGGESRFDYDIRRATRYAQALGTGLIHIRTGDAQGPEAQATLVDNLKRGCKAVPEGLTLLLAAQNPTDSPGAVLTSYDRVAEVIAAVDAPNLGLQFQSYQAQTLTGDAAACYMAHADLIRHIQIADTPDGTAPGTGEINFAALFSTIAASDYTGWISASYTPGPRTEQGLGWMRPYVD